MEWKPAILDRRRDEATCRYTFGQTSHVFWPSTGDWYSRRMTLTTTLDSSRNSSWTKSSHDRGRRYRSARSPVQASVSAGDRPAPARLVPGDTATKVCDCGPGRAQHFPGSRRPNSPVLSSSCRSQPETMRSSVRAAARYAMASGTKNSPSPRRGEHEESPAQSTTSRRCGALSRVATMAPIGTAIPAPQATLGPRGTAPSPTDRSRRQTRHSPLRSPHPRRPDNRQRQASTVAEQPDVVRGDSPVAVGQ